MSAAELVAWGLVAWVSMSGLSLVVFGVDGVVALGASVSGGQGQTAGGVKGEDEGKNESKNKIQNEGKNEGKNECVERRAQVEGRRSKGADRRAKLEGRSPQAVAVGVSRRAQPVDACGSGVDRA